MRAWLIVILAAGIAHADPEPSQRKWHLGVEAVTDFPLYVGAQVWVELPYRIRLSTSFGEMPDGYLDVINDVATSAGLYNQQTADLLEEALDHAFTWRLHAGWRPFKNRGGYIEAGFGTLDAHANLGITSLIQLATGINPPMEANLGLGFRFNTLVETVGVEVGWMWMPWKDLTLRVSLGFAATVGAQVTVTPNFATSLQGVFTRLVGGYVEDLIEKYLYIPTVGLAIGWRLY
jgi:hypothetical protein